MTIKFRTLRNNMTMEIEEKLTNLLRPMVKEMREKHDAANSHCISSPGSVTYIVRVMMHNGHRCFADDDLLNDIDNIAALYAEYRLKMSFTDAMIRAKSEWLAEYLSQNGEMNHE